MKKVLTKRKVDQKGTNTHYETHLGLMESIDYIIQSIENEIDLYYTRGRKTKNKPISSDVIVEVVTRENGSKYLRSVADGSLVNNLDWLERV